MESHSAWWADLSAQRTALRRVSERPPAHGKETRQQPSPEREQGVLIRDLQPHGIQRPQQDDVGGVVHAQRAREEAARLEVGQEGGHEPGADDPLPLVRRVRRQGHGQVEGPPCTVPFRHVRHLQPKVENGGLTPAPLEQLTGSPGQARGGFDALREPGPHLVHEGALGHGLHALRHIPRSWGAGDRLRYHERGCQVSADRHLQGGAVHGGMWRQRRSRPPMKTTVINEGVHVLGGPRASRCPTPDIGKARAGARARWRGP